MIPKLRFPPYNQPFVKKSINEILTIGSGKDYKHLNKGEIPVYGTGGLMTTVNDHLYDGESVGIGRKGTIDKPIFLKGKFWTVDTLFYTHSFEDVDPYYVFTLFQQINWKKYNEASGVPSLSKTTVGAIQVYVPRIEEQLRIRSLFEAVDQKINLLTKKKEALETYKRGLMQKIFSQELRFKRDDGTDYPEWTSYELSEILIEHKKRSDGSEQVHSVSVHKGVVNQIEHLGRSFAAKDVSNYNKVLFGDIIYTKSPTGDFPYGIIKQSYVENAIVSPLYCVTSPIDINIGYLLHWFFESKINVHNYLHPIIQKGAKNTINITNNTFLSRSLSLPSDKAEREKIKVVYSSLNDNLKTLESEIIKVTEFKKGLLQQMFV